MDHAEPRTQRRQRNDHVWTAQTPECREGIDNKTTKYGLLGAQNAKEKLKRPSMNRAKTRKQKM
eukprot:6991955-Karenia_brevis.AAC.1